MFKSLGYIFLGNLNQQIWYLVNKLSVIDDTYLLITWVVGLLVISYNGY